MRLSLVPSEFLHSRTVGVTVYPREQTWEPLRHRSGENHRPRGVPKGRITREEGRLSARRGPWATDDEGGSRTLGPHKI